MAALIQRQGVYYAQFFNTARTPNRKRHSLGTRRKDVARRKLAVWEGKVEQGHWDPWLENPDAEQGAPESPPCVAACTVRQALNLFLDRKRGDGRLRNTLRTYEEVINLLVESAGPETSLLQVSPQQVERIIRSPAVSQATQYKRYGHLRTFFRWSAANNFVPATPMSGITPPRKPQKLPKAVTVAELDLICDAVQAEYDEKRQRLAVRAGELVWRIPLFRYAFSTGMRGSELARLRWRDLDFDKRLVYIRVQKNHKEQTIPLNHLAISALKDVLRGDPEDYVFKSPRTGRSRDERYFVERASLAFRSARKRAGIMRRVSLHGLRHGFCTLLAERRAPLYVIQSAARHADLSTSLIYVHLANRHLLDAVDVALNGNGIDAQVEHSARF